MPSPYNSRNVNHHGRLPVDQLGVEELVGFTDLVILK